MFHNLWLRVAQLFGMTWRGFEKRAQNIAKGLLGGQVHPEEVLRRVLPPSSTLSFLVTWPHILGP